MTPLKGKLTVLPHLCLEELGNSSDTSKGKDSHVDADAAGGTVIVLVALGRTGTIALLATVLTLVGVLVVERALLLTIDLVVLLHVVEKLAELLDIGSGRNDDTAANLLKLGELDLLEAASESDTTSDLLKLGEIIDGQEFGVVLDSETATNRLQLRERDVGELLHVNQRKSLLDDSQVGSAERLELGVGAKLQALGNLLESGDHERLGAGDLDLGGGLKLVHGDLHDIVSVVEDLELGSDVDEVRVESVHLAVVVDLELLDGGNAKTAQVANEGIGDLNGLDLSNTLGTKVQLTETGKLDEVKLAQAGERGELEAAKSLKVVELELAANGVDRGTGNRDEVASTLGNEVTLDLFGAVDDNGTSNALVDSNIAIDNVTVNAGGGLGNLDVAGASGGSGNRGDTECRNGRKNLNGMHYDLFCNWKRSCDFVDGVYLKSLGGFSATDRDMQQGIIVQIFFELGR